MNPPLLVVGELCPDIIVTGVPTTGRSLRFGQAEDLVASTTLTLGSSAGITACAAAKAGTPVRLLAVIGDDDLGRACCTWLQANGVDTRDVRVDPSSATGSSVILVRADDTTDRQILTHPGAMAQLQSAHLTDELLGEVAHLHISSFFLHTAARESLHLRMAAARRAGLTVSLDTNDDPDRAWAAGAQAAIAQVDVLFVNDSEAQGLSGLGPDITPADAVNQLLTHMPPTAHDWRFPAVVHKLGPMGATVHTTAGTVHVPAPPVDVVDTVGAGDTLAGTALAALLGGADWPQALGLAVASGSRSTTGIGGVNAQPTLDEARLLAAPLPVTDDRHQPWEGTP